MTTAIYSIPGFLTSKMLNCTQEAEDILGTPPNIYECAVVIKRNHPYMPVANVYEVLALITSMMREDWLYTDSSGYKVSLKRHEGFTTFSEKCRSHFKGNYVFIKDGTLVTSKLGKTLNLDNVINTLKSKDISLFNAH